MLGDHPWQLSPGISFGSSVKVPNSESVVYFLPVGNHPWGVGDHPRVVGDHPWQLSPGVSFVNKV